MSNSRTLLSFLALVAVAALAAAVYFYTDGRAVTARLQQAAFVAETERAALSSELEALRATAGTAAELEGMVADLTTRRDALDVEQRIDHLAAVRRRARHPRPHLRQGRSSAGPQDGARDEGEPPSVT